MPSGASATSSARTRGVSTVADAPGAAVAAWADPSLSWICACALPENRSRHANASAPRSAKQ
jgi:hypothetical protein